MLVPITSLEDFILQDKFDKAVKDPNMLNKYTQILDVASTTVLRPHSLLGLCSFYTLGKSTTYAHVKAEGF